MDGSDNPNNHGMDDIGLRALAELICNLNPYAGVEDINTGISTDKMVVGNPEANTLEARIRSIPVDLERNYATTWSFKGQTESLKAAFRVPYTFRVVNKAGETLWWQTEHLLIGFAGGDAGG